MLSCALIEDDVISMKVIEGMAEKTGMLHIHASFTSSTEALKWLSTHQVDLLLLDVEMPELTGLELLRSLVYKPDVIIISSQANYAVDAYELSVIDFLLKPIKDYSRFALAINKVLAKRKGMATPTGENIFVRIESLLHKLNMDDILWVEAFGDYVKAQTTDKVHTVYSTLKKMEERLPSDKFIRVLRSFIVNLSKITNIDSNNLEINKKIIPISSSFKEELLNKIKVL